MGTFTNKAPASSLKGSEGVLDASMSEHTSVLRVVLFQDQNASGNNNPQLNEWAMPKSVDLHKSGLWRSSCLAALHSSEPIASHSTIQSEPIASQLTIQSEPIASHSHIKQDKSTPTFQLVVASILYNNALSFNDKSSTTFKLVVASIKTEDSKGPQLIITFIKTDANIPLSDLEGVQSAQIDL